MPGEGSPRLREHPDTPTPDSSRHREPWAVIAPALRASFDRARDGGATRGEKVTLAAVHHLLGTYQRLEDRISLGQIAMAEGSWGGPEELPDGTTSKCPERITNPIGKRLKRLGELGAVEYEPATYWRRWAVIRLPRAGEIGHETKPGGLVPDDAGPSRSDRQDQAVATTPPVRTKPDRASNGSGPSPAACLPRSSPRSSDRGGRTERAPADVGSLAARLSAASTTDALDDREAERASQLVLDHLPAAAVDEALEEVLAAGSLSRPARFLSALEFVLAESHPAELERLHGDARFRVLCRAGLALEIADACPGDWRAHAADADVVAAHLEEHLPGDLLDEVRAIVRSEGLTRPRLALRTARELAEDYGVDLPRLDLPTARTAR